MSEPKSGKSSKGKEMHYSVGALVKKEDKYLLIDRMNPPLGFAGLAGHIDEGEDAVNALKREVEEGIKFLIIKKWGLYPYYAFFVGLGYAFFEQYFKNWIGPISRHGWDVINTPSFWYRPSAGFVMHILYALIMGYFIKEGKPIVGLIIAVVLHALSDVLIVLK